MVRPVIEISPGLRLDDINAGKLVDRMLEALAYDAAHAEAMLQAMRANVDVGTLGNVVGQQRFFAKLKKALGRTLLSATLTPRSGNRFKLLCSAWEPVVVGGATLTKGAQAGWLAGQMMTLVGLGRLKGIDIRARTLCVLTRHALVRLVQRAECRTPEDLVALLSRAWQSLSVVILLAAKTNALPKGENAGWLVPVDNVFLSLRGDDSEQGFVTTVLSPDMIIDPAPAFALKARLDNPEQRLNDPELLAALQATTKATRMGRREG